MLNEKMAVFRTSRTFDTLFLLAIGVLLIVATLNRTAIGDVVFSATHIPTARTLEIASAASLTPAGAKLLERTNPQFEDAAEITNDCGPHRLGCLSGHGQSFILDEPAKPHQTVVTAAHEMLHLAYERLTDAKKAELAPLIDQAIAAHASAISDELSSQTDTSDRRDEAHSLLGTEYGQLPAELESYYATYFTTRKNVLSAAGSAN